MDGLLHRFRQMPLLSHSLGAFIISRQAARPTSLLVGTQQCSGHVQTRMGLMEECRFLYGSFSMRNHDECIQNLTHAIQGKLL